MANKKLIIASATVVVAIGAGVAWWLFSKPKLPAGFAGGNGRLEAQQYDISAKYAGRLKTVDADEGDTLEIGQVAATIDTEPLQAQYRASQARIKEAKTRAQALSDASKDDDAKTRVAATRAAN